MCGNCVVEAYSMLAVTPPRAAPIAIDTGPSSSRTCCTCENYDI